MGSIGRPTGNSFYSQQRDMADLVSEFESKINNPNLANAIKQYAYGTYGDSIAKALFDKQHGISDFIDRNKSLKMRDATLYRGAILTNSELQALKEGQVINNSEMRGLTSWSTREIVAHMYAQGDEDTGATSRGIAGNAVVFVNAHTNDAIPNPYSYPQDEALRSRSMKYTVSKIVPINQFKTPLARSAYEMDYYTEPVTYIYVTANKR